MTSKENVLSVYPDARIIESYIGGKFVSLGQHDGKELAYRSDGDEALLWDSAWARVQASKLPSGPSPAEETAEEDWFPYPVAAPIAPAAVDEGTFACPICGWDVPHYHSPDECAERPYIDGSRSAFEQYIQSASLGLIGELLGPGRAHRWQDRISPYGPYEHKNVELLWQLWRTAWMKCSISHPQPPATTEITASDLPLHVVAAAVRTFNANAAKLGYKYVVDRFVVEAMLKAALAAAPIAPAAEDEIEALINEVAPPPLVVPETAVHQLRPLLLELIARRKAGELIQEMVNALKVARHLDTWAYTQALMGVQQNNSREEELGRKIDAAKEQIEAALTRAEEYRKGAKNG